MTRERSDFERDRQARPDRSHRGEVRGVTECAIDEIISGSDLHDRTVGHVSIISRRVRENGDWDDERLGLVFVSVERLDSVIDALIAARNSVWPHEV